MASWHSYLDGHSGSTVIPLQGFEPSAHYHPPNPDDEDSQPIFTLGQVQFTLPSELFALACRNNHLVLACSGRPPRSSSSSSFQPVPPQLIRIDLDRPTDVDTFDLPFPSSPSSSSSSSSSSNASPPPKLHALHVSPSSHHLLLSTTTGDTFYLFLGPPPANLPPPAAAALRKPKHLARLKGAVIDSVAWAPTPSSSSSSSSPYSTRHILLGTSTGQLLETSLLDPSLHDPQSAFALAVPSAVRGSNGPERFVKQLLTLPVREAVVGLRYEVWTAGEGGKRRRNVAVVAATRTRVYQFVGNVVTGGGGGGKKGEEQEAALLEEVFKPYAADEARPKILELPGEPLTSELHFFAPPRSDGKGLGLPKTLAWMTGPGIYHAHLLFPSSDLPPGEGIIDSASLIPYPSLSSSPSSPGEEPKQPISMTLTEFHFVLLYEDRVVAVDLLTDRVVYEEVLDLPPTSPPLRLSTDPLTRTLWLHTDTAIYELVVRDEDRDVWKVWLKRGEWEKAKRAAKTPHHRSLILAREAASYFSAGRFIQAAQCYAQTDAEAFEEVVLRFVEKGERDALRYYLLAKLERLKKTDLTQRLALSTWLVELYLAKLNELDDLSAASAPSSSPSSGGGDGESDNLAVERAIVEEDLRGFLQTYKDHLDPRTTLDLLTRHGRDELTLFYAAIVGDTARIVRHHVEKREWKEALKALGGQDDLELYYRFASVLVRNAPKEAVDTFLREPRLSPRRLVPALVAPRLPLPSASTSPARDDPVAEHAVRYLHHAVFQQGSTDASVHNALVTLFATSSPSSPSVPESAFVRFLESAPTSPATNQPYFDLDYALRLSRQHGRTQACVVIYSAMGLYDESVGLALEQDDLELARVCADKPVEDEMLRKKLWLKVAKHVVGKKNDIKTAMRFLESTPLLKIEDILPFFPDFVVIDDFKDEICDALESYAAHIERLKADMADATRAAEQIKADMDELDQRVVVVDANDKCGSCGGQLLTRQFYVFPCQHSFHADCLIQEVTKTLSPTQLRRMLSLQAQLAPSSTTSSSAHRARTPKRTGTSSLPSLPEVDLPGSAGLKLAAQASVQAVDQLRRLVLPDALLSAIGGALPNKPNVPGVNGSSAAAGGNAQARYAGGSPRPGAAGGAGTDATSLSQSASARREAKEKLALREQLDELLARECVLCEGAIGSIEKGFVEEGEEM
ncbi:hypothetical protein JCM8097_000132 [Rhodosporidiobolus ruineniae]